MSKLNPSDHENVLDLIEAVYATPNVPGVSRSPCGYSLTNIIASLRLKFPNNTMTNEQVADILTRGVRSGVFSRSCSTAIPSSVFVCASQCDGEFLYRVNQNMVQLNPFNATYAKVFNPPAQKANLRGDCGGVNDPINSTNGSYFSIFTRGGGGSVLGSNC
jgi:hypothetical protein